MSCFQTRWLTPALLLAGLTSKLFAVDGVVLIDQAHALTGSITPGDAPGFPVTLSQPGSYRLTGNLTVPNANTTAILVTADNVSIDLNGFSIIGPVVCGGSPITCNLWGTGNGVDAGQNVGTSVYNGTVRGAGLFGVLMKTGTVDHVRANSNQQAGIVFYEAGTVTNSYIFNNGGLGISASDFGSVITGNKVSGNGGSGIATNVAVITGNVSSRNGGDGIGGSGVISANTVFGNTGYGIYHACPSSITGNSSFGNSAGNIGNNGQPGCVFANNAQ